MSVKGWIGSNLHWSNWTWHLLMLSLLMLIYYGLCTSSLSTGSSVYIRIDTCFQIYLAYGHIQNSYLFLGIVGKVYVLMSKLCLNPNMLYTYNLIFFQFHCLANTIWLTMWIKTDSGTQLLLLCVSWTLCIVLQTIKL